jgi:hypothetical protein
MRVLASLLIIVVASFTLTKDPSKSAQTYYDLSWPNCSLSQPPSEDSGIIGVNGGLNFKPNPCLAKEAGWFKRLSVYVNTGYPGIEYGRKFLNYPRLCAWDDNKCLAYNYGFNAGRYDIEYASLQGIVADRWWLDVETENSWTTDSDVNRRALTGMVEAISRYAGRERLGFYSFPAQWNLITGNWLNSFPAWTATGSTSRAIALSACNDVSFTGGKTLLTQYTLGLDLNYVCPSM